MSTSATEGPKDKPTTFHSFSQLPPEIKYTIWEYAARDVRRGAHFFSAASNWRGPTTTTFLGSDDIFGFPLAAPKALDTPDAVQDRVEGNPSSYIVDAGLWTACWDSRNVMKKRYQELGGLVKIPFGWAMAPFSSGHITHNDEYRAYQLCPTEDLFCIQLSGPTVPRCVMPTFRLSKSLRPTAIMNVALEYDPAWIDVSGHTTLSLRGEENPRGCFIRTLCAVSARFAPAGFEFWLIDRTIRKRNKPVSIYMPSYGDDSDEDIEEVQTKPRIFQGHGRRYVEVRDLSECEYDVLGQNTAFHFLHRLQMDAGFSVQWMLHQRVARQTGVPPPPMPSINGLGDLVKILCEERA